MMSPTAVVVAIVFGILMAQASSLAYRWQSGSSRAPYRTARLEGSTLILPGQRRSHLTGAALCALWGSVLLGFGWWDRAAEPVISPILMAGGAVLVLGTGSLLAWARDPGEVRMDQHHLTVDSRMSRTKVRWDQVTSAEPHPLYPQALIHFQPPAVELERRDRVGAQVLERTVVIPHRALTRADQVTRLVDDLRRLDELGRWEVLTQGALPMLTRTAWTRRQVDTLYEDQIRPRERHGAAVARRHDRLFGQR